MSFDDIVAEAEKIESEIKQPARASKQQLDIVALAETVARINNATEQSRTAVEPLQPFESLSIFANLIVFIEPKTHICVGDGETFALSTILTASRLNSGVKSLSFFHRALLLETVSHELRIR